MLSCSGPLALPGGRSVFKAGHICQRSGLTLVARASRKQSQKQSRDVGDDLASEALPADLDQLSKLAKAELQHQLEVRGLDKDGNKEELASRLLDNLIARESVLSTNPPDRVKLQQQLEQGSTAGRRGRRTSRKATASADPQPESSSVGSPQAADSVVAAAMTAETSVEAPAAAAAAGSRRGRKTSRKATSSVDPLPSAAEIAAGTAAEPVRRGRKTSRKATTSADPLPAAPADVLAAPAAAAAAAAEGASTDAKSARRGRKTSRKATTSAEPSDAPASLDPVAAAAEAAAAVDSATESVTSKQRGRRSSKTTAADPSPAAAAPTEEAAPAKAGRGRRASCRSSVLEPESTAASAEAPARQRGRRTSSAKSATSGAAAAAADEAAAPAPSTAAEAPVSRAKLLAQQLAKKEIATHGQGAAGAGAGAAPGAAAAAAAPGSAWVGADELLYAGSQAQSDNILMGDGDNSMQAVGAESSFTIDNGSVDEVMAQISAERAAGLGDEPQLRPEAKTFSSSFEGMMNPPSAGAADAAASWGAAAAAATGADAADGQHPSLTDCVAAVEEPLTTATEAVEVDEAPDAAMAAFDHMYVHIASPGAAEADLQHPNLSDCVAAVEEPLLAQADPAPLVVVDEAPDAAMAAFDHTSLDTPAAAAVAGGNQTPNLQDIALAVESSPLPPSLDESLGEDEEPDVALAAFDHIDVPAPAEATAAAVTDDGAAAAAAAAGGYDQAYLDPMQPSATVGSGSVDLADAEVVVTAAAAAVPAAPAAVPAAPAAVPAKQQQAQQQQQQKVGAGQGAPDLSVMVQRWWASVVAMFEDWQKNLSGPK